MPIDDAPTEARLPAAPPNAPGTTSLLVMTKAGVFTVALPREGELTIGRSPDCDVHLDDSKVSRVHAKLRVRDRFHVIDLGSLNGVLVGDRRAHPSEPMEVQMGDMITIGSTVLVLQSAAPQAPPVRVWSHASFEARLEEERRRAQQLGTTFGIVRIEFDTRTLSDARKSTSKRGQLALDVTRVELLELTLREHLRARDVIASHDAGAYQILLPETSPDDAEALAERLGARLKERGFIVDVGVACFPRDGSTRESLEAQAGAALHEPTEEEAPQSRQLDMGAMRRLEPLIERIAAGVINVLILGETGVGKEVMARTIHEKSPRAQKPLVCINCAALTESLLESELFGHERGAFTGAVQSKPGLIEAADGGTLFLDEVGEMPLPLQAKLLRVLEQREVQRVGSLKPRPVDVRFIAATNRDLEREIEAGRFRQDLYFRLNGISFVIPPLRERIDEIEPLARQFAARACEQSSRPPVRISPQVLAFLKRYAWPGNVRELRNVMERAVLLCSGDEITLEHVPSNKKGPIVAARPAPRAEEPRAPEPPTFDSETTNVSIDLDQIVGKNASEKDRIIAALDACAGNQTHAARLLGISRRTLITRIEDYNLPRPRKKGSGPESG